MKAKKLLYFITNYSGEILTANDVKCEIMRDNTVLVFSSDKEILDTCTGYATLEDLKEAIK